MKYVTVDLLKKAKAADVEKAVHREFELAALKLVGKSTAFVAASGVKCADSKKVSIFLPVKDASEKKLWTEELKTRSEKFTTGLCTVNKNARGLVIEVVQAQGGADQATKTAVKAFATLKQVTVTGAGPDKPIKPVKPVVPSEPVKGAPEPAGPAQRAASSARAKPAERPKAAERPAPAERSVPASPRKDAG